MNIEELIYILPEKYLSKIADKRPELINWDKISKEFKLSEDFIDVLYNNEYVFRSSCYIDALYVIYGVYMAKRSENIRRQHNDPRYTGKSEGSIVGIEV